MTFALPGRSVLSLVLLLGFLVVCNLAFAYSHGWTRWGWQVFGFGGLFLVYHIAGLTLGDIGLSKDRIVPGLKYGAVAMAVILATLIVAYLVKHSVFQDNRYNQSLKSALAAGLLIVPLKIVLFEELAFRGILPALLKDLGSKPWVIVLVSALLFGLWHIATAPKSNNIPVGSFSNILIVGGIFVATSVAGALLYYLRYKSGSIVAPMLVHWLINGSAIILAAVSWLAVSGK